MIFVQAAGASCGDDVTGVRSPTDTQEDLARTLAAIGLTSDHEVLMDTTAGSHLPPSTVLDRIDIDVPFQVKQLKDRKLVAGTYGRPRVVVRPVRGQADPLGLTLEISPRDQYQLSREDKHEVRREMAVGNLRALGDDPLVQLLFNLKCEPAPEINAWTQNLPYRHIRLTAESQTRFIESLGTFEAVERMRRLVPDVRVDLWTTPVFFSPSQGRLHGSVGLLVRPEVSGLRATLALYLDLFRIIGETRSAWIGRDTARSRLVSAAGDELRDEYRQKLVDYVPREILRNFDVTCSGLDLQVEGYEGSFQKPPAVETSATAQPKRQSRRSAKRAKARAAAPAVDAKPARE